MIPKKNWKIYSVRSGDTSRHITTKSSGGRLLESLAWDDKHQELKIKRLPTGWCNCCFDVPDMPDGTKGMPYVKTDDYVDCYKFNLDGRVFYIPIEAFNKNHYNNNLDICSECQDGIVDVISVTDDVEQGDDIVKAIEIVVTVIKDRCPAFRVSSSADKAYIYDANNYHGAPIFILSPYSELGAKPEYYRNESIATILFYDSEGLDDYFLAGETKEITSINDLLQKLEFIVKTLYSFSDKQKLAKQLDSILNDLYINL